MTTRQPIYLLSSKLRFKTYGWMYPPEWRWFVTRVDSMAKMPRIILRSPEFLLKNIGCGRTTHKEPQGPPLMDLKHRGSTYADKDKGNYQ